MKTLSELRKKEGFNLWQSETDWSGVDGENAGDMASALWFSKKIIKDINGLSPSAWIMWLTIDLHRSKDGYGGNPDWGNYDESKGFWGLTCCDHDKKEIILTQKYYACGQFSRYIRPGMTLVHIDKNTLGAYDKENKKLVVVAVNTKGKSRKAELDLSDFLTVGAEAQVIVTSGNTVGGKKWHEEGKLRVENKIFRANLEPNSVTTFIIENTSI
jgi:O-glycosyl hydrolase